MVWSQERGNPEGCARRAFSILSGGKIGLGRSSEVMTGQELEPK